MDLNDLWQEHKNWILGILVAAVAVFIGSSVIASNYSVDGAESQIRRARGTLSKGSFYDKKAQQDAGGRLRETRERLSKLEALSYFAPRESFLLEGKGDFSTYYLSETSRIEADLRRRMNTANVDFLASSIGLPGSSPTEREEVQRILIGVDMVEDALVRLLAASDEVVRELPGQAGLRAIEQLQIGSAKRANRRTRRPRGEEESLGTKVTARLGFRADSITLERWLERLIAQPGSTAARRPILLESIEAEDVGRDSGEPLKIDVTLLVLIPNEKGN